MLVDTALPGEPNASSLRNEIDRIAQSQLFLIGGAPRSGTTWLQRLLDGHKQISCGGEGLFSKELAAPLDRLLAARSRALNAKNKTVFSHAGGYALPQAEDGDFLLGEAILLALRRQAAGRVCSAYGEKTPENVFFFARMKSIFPHARFIGIVRDPRDVLASAWHFFHQPSHAADDDATKIAFLRSAFASLASGTRTMLALAERHPADCAIVTYEALIGQPAATLGRLYRFLGVDDAASIVEDCLDANFFDNVTSGKVDGIDGGAAFFRKGVVGDWRSTLTREMGEMVLHELGWMWPHFGWSI